MLVRDRPEEIDRLGEGKVRTRISENEDEVEIRVTLPSPADLPQSQEV